jgi:mono/diheme cytochrome c family protein
VDASSYGAVLQHYVKKRQWFEAIDFVRYYREHFMWKSGLSVLLIFTVFCSAPSGQTQSTPAKHTGRGDVHAGQDLFTQKCFQCHSVNEGQVRLGPSLFGEMKGPDPKKTAAEIRGILKDGKGKMPSFKEVLTQKDTDDLIAYLHTL